MKIEIYIFIIIGCYLSQTTDNCPSAEVLLPCRCQTNVIICDGRSYYNLRNIFVSLSSALKNEEKHFNEFYFNKAIDELVENVFYDITFESIWIQYSINLTKINTLAFNSTYSYVTHFYLIDTPCGGNILDDNNILDLINHMVNIKHLMISNTSLTSIPSKAFTALNSLTYLRIDSNNHLKTLGNNAFYDLNSLTILGLNNNPLIETFPEHAFSFRNRNSNNTLQIYLNDMPKLNINSFAYGTFSTINRVIMLYFNRDTQIKYLDENIYHSVLAIGNKIELNGTSLECDCKTNWLYANKAVFQSLVLNYNCTDGQSVFAERENYLDCTV